jgi:hypothetical protein
MQAAEHELSRRRPTECGKRQNPVLPPVVGTSVQIRRRIIAATDYHPLGPGSTLSTDGAWCLAGTTGTRGLVSDPESDGAAMGYWLGYWTQDSQHPRRASALHDMRSS